MPLNSGQIVGERYRVVQLLGQGGMGAVYRAWDTRLNRPVALKEMIPQSGLDADMLTQLRQQFQQEAQVLGTLVHPSLVRVTDYFSWSGNEYLVMDFVEGESLAEKIQQEGAQPEAQVLAWTRQLLDALTYCHGRGVIHRDIKPQNIVITPESKAVLVDFGLVKLWDPQDPHTRTVMRGAGTPEYAPPEQYDMGLGHTDPRSDIYGLGATIYHALTGQIPPTATQRMASPSSFVPPRRANAGISPTTEAFVLKGLEIAMERRYQSAEEMTRALDAAPPVSPGRPIQVQTTHEGTLVLPSAEARPTPQPMPRSAPGKKRGLWIGLAVAAGLCLMLAVGGWAILYIIGRQTATPTSVAVQPSATADRISPVAEATTATSAPTPTERPTSAPTLHPTSPPADTRPTGDVLFQDNFSNPGSGWQVGDWDGGSGGYKDGVYFVRGEDKDYYFYGRAEQSFTDIAVEVDASQVLAPPNNNDGYGVGCRVQSNGHGYFFRISGDGYYSILNETGEDDTWLVDWTESTAIRQGNATNHIVVICNGSHLALSVNGELLAEVEDITYTEGDIALTATTFEDEPTEVHFDNLVVRRSVSILYQDDFSSASSGWEVGDYEGGSAGYKNGVYFVTSVGNNATMWGVANASFTDTIIEVDTTQVSAPANDNNDYGVVCRNQPDSLDGYYLLISGDGGYAILRAVAGSFEPLVDWATSDAINEGNVTNHIRAICNGDYLALSVNGELLAEVNDTALSQGDIALTATSYEDEPTEIHFDNLVVYAP